MAPFLDHDLLSPLVVEVTEQVWPERSGPAEAALAGLRERGALLAVDDVGAGFAGLAQISRLRPEFVKLDRALIADLGVDPAAELVVDALGRLCGQLDAWVVAEGIERADQLSVLVRLGVPLGQGFLLGRGERPWPAVHGTEEVLARVCPPVGVDGRAAVGSLVLDASGTGWERDVTGAYRLPVEGRVHRATTMAPATRVADALLRAVARPPEDRWMPVLVTDSSGAALGQVTVETLITAALGASPDPPPPDPPPPAAPPHAPPPQLPPPRADGSG
jgi:EAL domain-containing protein (putative c-di-GMP-specific phosphodiesterase class I)